MAIPSYTTFKHHNSQQHHNKPLHFITTHNYTHLFTYIATPHNFDRSRVRKSRNITSLMLDDHDQVPGCAALSHTLHHIGSRIGDLRLTDNTLRVDVNTLRDHHHSINTLRVSVNTFASISQYIACFNTLRVDTLCVDADTLLKFTHSYIHTLRECTVETQFDTLRGHKQYIVRIFHPA